MQWANINPEFNPPSLTRNAGNSLSAVNNIVKSFKRKQALSNIKHFLILKRRIKDNKSDFKNAVYKAFSLIKRKCSKEDKVSINKERKV